MVTKAKRHSQMAARPAYWREANSILSFVPMEELTTPKTGTLVVCNQYWLIHKTRGAVFFQKYRAQYGHNFEVQEFLRDRLYPWADVQKVDVAYIPTRHQEK